MLSFNEKNYYLQQLKLPEVGKAGQIQLKKASVLCIGAGGLGCPLLYYLAAAGVGRIGIIDDDLVEESNLQRQILYSHEDIGRKKSHAAKQRLEALNPYIEVHATDDKLQPHNAKEWISGYDIVADCSDNFSTRYLINDTCFSLNKPFVFASILRFQGECAFFSGKKSPCFRCVFPHASERMADCRDAGVLGVVPGLLGVIQASQILNYLLNPVCLSQYLLTIDTLTMQFKKFELTNDPSCLFCSGKLLGDEMDRDNPFLSCISYEELANKLRAAEDIILLDVRSQEEHETANLGGVLIPLSELHQRLDELDISKTIIVYCQSGSRSIAAAKLLAKRNVKSVYYLKNGMGSQ